MVIGSSNLTSNALKVNYEHNVLLSTMKNGDLVNSVKMNLTCYGKRVPHLLSNGLIHIKNHLSTVP